MLDGLLYMKLIQLPFDLRVQWFTRLFKLVMLHNMILLVFLQYSGFLLPLVPDQYSSQEAFFGILNPLFLHGCEGCYGGSF